MNFDASYRMLGHVDVDPITEAITRATEEEWDADNAGQAPFTGPVQRDTKTIGLVFDWKGLQHPQRLPRYADFQALLLPILVRIRRAVGGGWPARCLFVRLRAGGVIGAHADERFDDSHRIHVPLVTNERAVFTVGGERKHMRKGEIWELNNARVHSVENLGDEGRIHLLFNWTPVTLARTPRTSMAASSV